MSAGQRQQREAQRQWAREQKADRKLHRDMQDIDHHVIQKGFGFLYAMLRADLPGEPIRHHLVGFAIQQDVHCTIHALGPVFEPKAP